MPGAWWTLSELEGGGLLLQAPWRFPVENLYFFIYCGIFSVTDPVKFSPISHYKYILYGFKVVDVASDVGG